MEKIIKCKECNTEFVFTENEQKFYEEKGFPEPKRCKECRKLKQTKYRN